MNDLTDQAEDNPLELLRRKLMEDPDFDYGAVLPLAVRKGSPASEPPGLALPGMVRSPLLGLIDLMQGKTAPDQRSLTPESLDTLGALIMPGARPNGSAGMFAGIRANTAPTRRLARAEAMISGDATPAGQELARKFTGWFLGPDGEWRWELPDNKAKLNESFFEEGKVGSGKFSWPSGFNWKSTPPKLPEIIDHPDLFKAYPELRDIDVKPVPGFNFGIHGAMDAKNKTLYLNGGRTADDMLGTTLHEVQHYIQTKEDFAQGANPSMFLPPDWDPKLYSKVASDRYKKAEDLVSSLGKEPHEKYDLLNAMELPEEVINRRGNKRQKDLLDEAKAHPDFPSLLESHTKHIELQDIEKEASQNYWKMYGEAEARATDKRKSLNQVERRELSPIDHINADVKPEDQLVFKGSELAFSDKEPGHMASMEGYQGSPHEFERHSDEAVGSGEGAASYGWGHYIAENPTVAEEYRRRLAKGSDVLFEGKHLDQVPEVPRFAKEALIQTQDPDAAARVVGRWAQMDQHKENFSPEAFSEAQAWLSKNSDKLTVAPRGSLYKVRAKPDPEHLLDWDKPLSEQSPYVKDKLDKIDPQIWNAIDDALDGRNLNPMSDGRDVYHGEEFYKALKHGDVHEALPAEVPGSSWMTGETDEKKHTSKFLNSIGIPGIKYLDQGSRMLAAATPMDIKAKQIMIDGLKQSMESMVSGLKNPHPNDARANSDAWKREVQKHLQFLEGTIASHQKELETMQEGKHLTRNLVIFDPENLEITHRNGTPLKMVPRPDFEEESK